MKKLRNISRILLGGIIAFYLIVVVALNTNTCQRWIAQRTANTLTELIGSEVTLDKVEIGLFNHITLHNLQVKDKQGRVALVAPYASAKIQLSSLLDGRIELPTISLLDANIMVCKDAKDGDINIQHIINAFKSKDDNKKKPLNLTLNSIILRRCSGSYDDNYISARGDKRIDPHHIAISDLNASLSLKQITNDSISVRLRGLSLKEKSGLCIESLMCNVNANKREAQVSMFELKMPNTTISIPETYASYDVTHGFKQLLPTLSLNTKIDAQEISAKDFAFLVAQLEKTPTSIALISDIKLTPEDYHATIDLAESTKHFIINSRVQGKKTESCINSANLDISNLYVDAEYINGIAKGIFNKELPSVLTALKFLNADGNVNYTPTAISTNMNLATAAGNAVVENVSSISGKQIQNADFKITSEGINIASLLNNNEYIPSFFAGEANGTLSFSNPNYSISDVMVDVLVNSIEWKGQRYSNIDAKATVKGNALAIDAASQDPELQFTFSGNAQKDLSQLDFVADVPHINVKKLNLPVISDWQTFSGHIEGNLANARTSQPVGNIDVSNLTITRMVNDSLVIAHLGNLTLKSEKSGEDEVHAKINSDFAHGEIQGKLDVKSLRAAALQIVRQHLSNIYLTEAEEKVEPNRWNFALHLDNTEFLQKLINIPITAKQSIQAEGYLDSQQGVSYCLLNAPSLSIKGTELSNVRFYLHSDEHNINSLLQANKRISKKDVKFEVQAETSGVYINSRIDWSTQGEKKYNGTISNVTDIRRSHDGRVSITTDFMPTDIYIKDTLWQVKGGHVEVNDGTVNIRGLKVQHDATHGLTINGGYSKTDNDSIVANLNNINLAYIISLVNFNAVEFGGLISGQAVLTVEDNTPDVRFHLTSPSFLFNKTSLGEADIVGDFNIKQLQLNINGDMQEHGEGCTKVDGFVNFKRKGLDLYAQAERTNLAFLNKFVNTIFGDVQGRGSGRCHIYGPFKELDFEGGVLADAQATVLATGVRYNVNDCQVSLMPGCFKFVDGHINDYRTGNGIVEGELRHQHLKDINYDFNLQAENMLLYDKPREMDMPFYATAVGTGSVHLFGKPGLFQADIAVSPIQGTDATYIVDSPETASASTSLVQFASKSEEDNPHTTDSIITIPVIAPITTPEESATDIRLNFLVDMNPAANLNLLMDEKTGDKISVNGNGSIRATYYNKGTFLMYGNFEIERGTYRFSIQDLIHKQFQFTSGSRIVFAGDPFQAALDLKAIYVVPAASLADLNTGASFSENNVRVNCILNIGGIAGNPQVTFDLDLPTVNEDEKQMVRRLIATEEDMNIQIIYLLGIGRFYTFDYASTSTYNTAALQSTAAVNSFISNTLSAQLNEIISSALKNNNWSFGANFATGQMGWNDMEVEALMSGRLLNNRLLLNGQFGYRDRPTYSTTQFIGDFDLQYLLTKSGTVSLKAYSETNDRYFTKSSLTTQGIGFILKKDFTTLPELITPRRRKKK